MEVEVPAESQTVYAPLTDGVVDAPPVKRRVTEGHAVTLHDLRKDLAKDGPCHLVCACGVEQSFLTTPEAIQWVTAHLERTKMSNNLT